MIKYLPPKENGYQGAERAGGGVAEQFQVAYLLSDDVEAGIGAQGLYLWTEYLANRHVPQVEGGVIGYGGATEGGRYLIGRARQGVGDHIGRTWHVSYVGGVFGDVGELALLPT